MLKTKLSQYVQLTRLDKPIGIWLLLWPTLWGVWIASAGNPSLRLAGIFIAGVILMRSAGCIINDIADRNFDGHVARTKQRPLASGAISLREAICLFGFLVFCSFLLALQLNQFALYLSLPALLITMIYPFMKRYTHFPQAFLGIAFAFGIPMVFANQMNSLPIQAWLCFLSSFIWSLIYDTIYAMADREDDLKIGLKSTAILFGRADKLIIGILQLLFLGCLISLGLILKLNFWFYLSLAISALFFGYHQYLIADRNPQKCFQAFLNNHWVGVVILLGLILTPFPV